MPKPAQEAPLASGAPLLHPHPNPDSGTESGRSQRPATSSEPRCAGLGFPGRERAAQKRRANCLPIGPWRQDKCQRLPRPDRELSPTPCDGQALPGQCLGLVPLQAHQQELVGPLSPGTGSGSPCVPASLQKGRRRPAPAARQSTVTDTGLRGAPLLTQTPRL